MKNWQSSNWKLFNILGRVVGAIFIAGGVIIALGSQIDVHGGTKDSFAKWVGATSGIVMAILGFLMVKARPSKPPNFPAILENIRDKLDGKK